MPDTDLITRAAVREALAAWMTANGLSLANVTPFDIAGVPGVACEMCRYAEDEATTGGLNELHEPGTTVFSCRNGVCWLDGEPDMNPWWFGCSLWGPRDA